MGDRVAVMRKGELQQVATPQELYDRPVNLFVGGFIGSPAMNMLEADARARERRPRRSKMGEQRLTLDPADARTRPGARGVRGQAGDRRHPARGHRGRRAVRRRSPADARSRAKVELREALGSEIMVHLASTPAGGDRRGPRAGRGRRRRRARGRRRARRPIVGRFTARSRSQGRASSRGRRRHRAACTSSTPRPASGSTATTRRKEPPREEHDSLTRSARLRTDRRAGRRLRQRRQRQQRHRDGRPRRPPTSPAASRSSASGPAAEQKSFQAVLDGFKSQVPQGHRQVHAGRRQHADRARHRGRRAATRPTSRRSPSPA